MGELRMAVRTLNEGAKIENAREANNARFKVGKWLVFANRKLVGGEYGRVRLIVDEPEGRFGRGEIDPGVTQFEPSDVDMAPAAEDKVSNKHVNFAQVLAETDTVSSSQTATAV